MKQEQIYFEKQKSYNNLCCMHAINNLLGYSAATQKDLNQLCKQLSDDFINPHKHFLGGDYDANVLMLALQNLGNQTRWIDNREQAKVQKDSLIQKEDRIGYIINKQTESSKFKKFIGLSDRHWVAIKCINGGTYIELDSKKEYNEASKLPKISQYLKSEMKKGSHIIQVKLAKSERIDY